MILGIYTGVGKTGDEMDKETSKHPTGKGGLVLDKVKTLEQTLDKQQGMPHSLTNQQLAAYVDPILLPFACL